jgi:hypothetical protein
VSDLLFLRRLDCLICCVPRTGARDGTAFGKSTVFTVRFGLLSSPDINQPTRPNNNSRTRRERKAYRYRLAGSLATTGSLASWTSKKKVPRWLHGPSKTTSGPPFRTKKLVSTSTDLRLAPHAALTAPCLQGVRFTMQRRPPLSLGWTTPQMSRAANRSSPVSPIKSMVLHTH